jgi:hypothetical protein
VWLRAVGGLPEVSKASIKEHAEHMQAVADEYLGALKITPSRDPAAAARMAGVKMAEIHLLRRIDASFVAKEAELAKFRPKPVRTLTEPTDVDRAKHVYLELLDAYRGNSVQARRDVGATNDDLRGWRERDAEFKQREDEVYEGINAALVQKTVEHALGEGERLPDSGHTRAVLGKLIPDQWGEKPKQVEHRHSGEISVKATEATITELLGDDDTDLLLPE